MSVSTENIQLSAASANKLRGALLGLGGLGLIGSFAGGFTSDPKQFYFSYLVAFAFTFTMALGLLFFTVLQHVVAARWSVVVRRIAETVASNTWVLAILFLPIAIGAHELYHWTHEEAVAADHLLQGKKPWLNLPFFYTRAAIYFIAWTLIGRFFYGNSVAQDQDGEKQRSLRMRKYGGPSLAVFALTLTSAGLDWMMSLDPHWYSTMFGVYIFAGSFVSAIAILILLVRLVQSMGYLKGIVSIEHYHDLGKLLFAFTVFWTYISFSQYFLIWYSNIPEETMFFIHRWEAGWKQVSLAIVVGHFIIPFIVLLSRHPKRRPAFLALVALWMVGMHYVDMYWLVMPTLHHDVHFHWLDIATLVGVAGMFFGTVAWRLGKNALIPVKDPFLKDSLEFTNV